ncbi:MAG: PhzF family phenazine biosynthesis protein [Cellvibrionaceae bacterium]
MELDLYQVDAFAEKVFQGNPAAICPLEEWLPDELMQKIAEENNLSETAFFVPEGDNYHLRWFTPKSEVDLCGHATLAAAHVLFTHLGYNKDNIAFETRSGILEVKQVNGGYSMLFPASLPTETTTPEALIAAIGTAPVKILSAFDYIAVLENETQVRELQPNLHKVAELDLRGLLVTAPGDNCDFVSRCFFPNLDIPEDPVTGSAHCELSPYWGEVLGKTELNAMQLSERSGAIVCVIHEDKVELIGKAVDYLKGTISV